MIRNLYRFIKSMMMFDLGYVVGVIGGGITVAVLLFPFLRT